MIPEKWLGDLYENKTKKDKKKNNKKNRKTICAQRSIFIQASRAIQNPLGYWLLQSPFTTGDLSSEKLVWWQRRRLMVLYAADTALNVHESTMCNAGKQQAKEVCIWGEVTEEQKLILRRNIWFFVVATGCLYAIIIYYLSLKNLLHLRTGKTFASQSEETLRPALTDYCTDLFCPRIRDIPRDML